MDTKKGVFSKLEVDGKIIELPFPIEVSMENIQTKDARPYEIMVALIRGLCERAGIPLQYSRCYSANNKEIVEITRKYVRDQAMNYDGVFWKYISKKYGKPRLDYIMDFHELERVLDDMDKDFDFSIGADGVACKVAKYLDADKETEIKKITWTEEKQEDKT